MTTSGTIGATTVETRKVLEHALRRCGISATAQTPEIVSLALDNLFLLLLNLSAKGINLWTVDKQIIPVVAGQVVYPMPPGTIDILNMVYATCTYITGTNSASATTYQVQLASPTAIVRVGFTLTALPTTDLLVQSSSDGVTWTTTTTIDTTQFPAVNQLAYFDVGTSNANGATYWRLFANGATFTATQLLLISKIRELPVPQMNRDDYSSLPDKYIQGRPSVNFYYEKLVNPQFSVWPVSNNSTDMLVVWRYRQPQDVGSLAETMELPARWYEAIIWQLAARLCFEIPQIDPSKAQLVLAENDKWMSVTEGGETDGSPIYFTPGIGVYNR
jgi:hypothetical protein